MQNLGMKRVMAKFIPWLLLPEQKEHHTNNLVETTTNEQEFLKKVINGD